MSNPSGKINTFTKIKKYALTIIDVVFIAWSVGFIVCVFTERYPYYAQDDYAGVAYERISFQVGLDDDYTPVIHSKTYGDNCDKSIYLSEYINTIDTRLLRAKVADIEKNGFTFKGYFGKYCYWERSEGSVDAEGLKKLNLKTLRFEILMGLLLLVWPVGRYIRNNHIAQFKSS